MTEKPKQKRAIPLMGTKKDAPRKKLYGAFDTETHGLGGDFLFATAQAELEPNGKRTKIYEFRTALDLCNYLSSNADRKIDWYAHNLEYDAPYLMAEFSRLKNVTKIIPRERGLGKFFRIDIYFDDDRQLTLLDSMALYGFSLAQFGAEFGGEMKGKRDIGLADGVIFDVKNQQHIDYARHDTELLLECMVNFNAAVYDLFGVNCRNTISSTSLAAWKTTLDKTHKWYRLKKPVEKFCRNAYHGGITFLTSTRSTSNCISLDVNSEYPYVMRAFGVPAGTIRQTHEYEPGRVGVYLCRVDNRACEKNFGRLPFRDSKNQLAWAVGDFECYAWSADIAHAIGRGYKIEVINGYIFERCDFPFKTFIDNCEKLRADHKGTGFETVVKLMQNSLYGKFGSKEEARELEFNPSASTELQPYVLQNGDIVPGLYYRDVIREANYMLPHWAGWITTQARQHIFRQIDAVEKHGGKCLLTDTDSIKCTHADAKRAINSGGITIGKKYGELKIDGHYREFKAIAPKVYSAITADGNYVGAVKGIPQKMLDQNMRKNIHDGLKIVVEYDSLEGMKKFLTSGKRELLKRTRTLTDLEKSPNWFAIGDEVYAVRVKNDLKVKTLEI